MFMGLVFMRSFALQNRILIKKYLSNLFAVKKAGNLNISLSSVMEFSFNVFKQKLRVFRNANNQGISVQASLWACKTDINPYA